MSSVRRALALSFIERYFSIVVALGSSMLLARLLTPEQIGMYSVSLAVIGIAHVLREFGVGNFLIQQKDLNDNHVRTAFGLALVLGGTLALVIYAAAPWVARFYDAPEMAGLMRIVALNFLVLPFCSISLSLLRRDMKFKALLYVSLGALLLSTAVTLGLAWAGYGPTSLAVGSVVGNVATGFGAWWARGRPALLRPGWREWRVVLNFGGQSAVTGIVTSVAMDINDLVVGKVLGFAPVAILSRAQGLMNMVHRDLMGAVRNVALPAFSQGHRDGVALEPVCIKATGYLIVVTWPFYALLSAYALEATRLLFGPQWDAAAALVPIFCATGAAVALVSIVPSALIAVGRIDLVTKFELTMQPLRIAITVFAVVTWQTVEAAAIAYLLSGVIGVPLMLAIKHQAIKIDFLATWVEIRRAIIATLIAVVPAIAHLAFGQRSDTGTLPVWQVMIAGALGIFGWVVALVATRHPLMQEPFVLRVLEKTPWMRLRVK